MANPFTREFTRKEKKEFMEERENSDKDDDRSTLFKGIYVRVKRDSVTHLVLVYLELETGKVTLSWILPNFDENTWSWDDSNEIDFDAGSEPLWETHPLTQGLKIVAPPDVNILLDDSCGKFSNSLSSVEA